MTPLVDLDPLLPTGEDRAARRDALVAELERSDAPRARTPRVFGRARPRLLPGRGSILVAAAALGLVAAFVVPRLGGVDVVDSARAAIVVPRNGILHTVVRYEPGPGFSAGTYWDGDPRNGGRVIGKTTGDSERWTTGDPWRQRDIRFYEKRGGGVETTQTAYAPGAISIRNSWEGRTVRTPVTPKLQKTIDGQRRWRGSDLDGIAEGFTQDPVMAMSALVRSGKLRDAGRTELGGQDVRRLVGTEPGYRDSGGHWSPKVEFEYFVDDETYVPREVRATQVLPADPKAEEPAARTERRLVQRWIFETFERLPLNAETDHLLEIDPAR